MKGGVYCLMPQNLVKKVSGSELLSVSKGNLKDVHQWVNLNFVKTHCFVSGCYVALFRPRFTGERWTFGQHVDIA